MTARSDPYARPTPQPRGRTPEQAEVRRALQALTSLPEWQVFLAYQRDRLWRETAAERDAEASALFVGAGRRSLLHDLETLGKRVADDGPGDQHG